jgi:hypothetical protein
VAIVVYREWRGNRRRQSAATDLGAAARFARAGTSIRTSLSLGRKLRFAPRGGGLFARALIALVVA